MRVDYQRLGILCLALSCAAMVALLLYSPDAEAQPTRGTAASDVEASPDAYKLARGEYEVKSAEFDLPDAARGKDLPLKVYAPTTGGPYPVIIFSHGAGGNRNVAPGLARHWASHGYVVIAPSHADSTDFWQRSGKGHANPSRVGEGDSPNSVQPSVAQRSSAHHMDDVLKSFGTDPNVRIGRVEDIKLILTRLTVIQELAPLTHGKINPDRIGLGGHSAGAMTASLVGGTTVDMGINGPGGAETVSFRDERIDAVLLLSGQGMTGPGGGFHRHSWNSMDLPVMVQTGSHDNSLRTRQTSASRRHPYDYAPAGDKYLVYIEGALHMSFTGRAANLEPGLAARWLEQYLGTPDVDTALEYDQRAIFDYIITSTQAFWDAYLKDDSEAKLWLASNKLTKLSKAQVEFLRK